MSSAKTDVIERLFERKWRAASASLSDPVVTLAEVVDAIREHNAAHPEQPLSDRNPANFFKDFVRNKHRANENWPPSVWARGYTGWQRTGGNACFQFVPLAPGQTEPFSRSLFPAPSDSTPRHRVESASLPLASRRLGRSDEPWLVQVVVRLRVIETHLSLFSPRNIRQLDHLQMSVKLARSEIDALFLALELEPAGGHREIIVCCEAKGRRDDILEDQILRQVEAVFTLPGVTQDLVLPIVVKALQPSQIHVIEFQALSRDEIPDAASLTLASEAVYEFVPPVPGIGA